MRALPDPAWIALDTPGADFEVSFVKTEQEATDFADGEEPAPRTYLYTADQMLNYAAVTHEQMLEAGRLWCDEGWAIDDEEPGWVYQRGGGPGARGPRRDVGLTLWWLMKAIRYGVGYAAERRDRR